MVLLSVVVCENKKQHDFIGPLRQFYFDIIKHWKCFDGLFILFFCKFKAKYKSRACVLGAH